MIIIIIYLCLKLWLANIIITRSTTFGVLLLQHYACVHRPSSLFYNDTIVRANHIICVAKFQERWDRAEINYNYTAADEINK